VIRITADKAAILPVLGKSGGFLHRCHYLRGKIC
jgi:hypothetical protein